MPKKTQLFFVLKVRESERGRGRENMSSITIPRDLPSPEEDCQKLKKAFHVCGTHKNAVIEILGHRNAKQRVEIARTYLRLYNQSLIDRLKSELSDHFELLVRLVSSYRYAGDDVDEALARSEAAKLHDAIRNSDLHHEEVVRILGTRSKPHLRATFMHYMQDYGKTIEQDIEENKNSDETFVSLLKVAVCCLASPEKHFAEVVRNSIVRLGTDEDPLTRAIVTRAEVDMKKIKEEYKKYGIAGDMSGDYKKFLLTLVGWGIP